MPKNPEMNISYDIYEDAVNMLGSGEITMPDIDNMTQTITGAGIAGEVEAVAIGIIKAMSMAIKWRTVTTEVLKLYEQRRHNLELRVAQQAHDSAAARTVITGSKFVVGAVPKKLGLGTVAPASPANAASDFSVLYLAQYINGAKVLEIDPINYIFFVNGTDYLAEVRTQLGR